MNPRTRFALMSTLVLALTPGMARAEVGLRLGLNAANIRGDFADLIETDARLGFVGGVFYAIPLAPRISVQAEALYSMKGFEVHGEGTDEAGNVVDNEAKVTLHYLEVPVMMHVGLGSGLARPFLAFGPSFGIRLHGEQEYDFGSSSGSEDFTDDMKPVDVGVAAAAGLEVAASPLRLQFEGRYTTGFTDLWDIDDNYESINSVFSFSVAMSRGW